jgi:hypothetical protein
MVPVGRSVRREYAEMQRSFTCCVGSGMESHALHGLGIYYEAGDRLWVNLYVPSTAEWTAAGARLEMATDFPEGESATLTLELRAPKRLRLALRRPGWAGERFAVSVNGEALDKVELPPPPGYVELDRTWKDGDRVSLVLPKTVRLEPTPDRPRRAAILWGPLVLGGDLGPEPERGQRGSGPRPPRPETPVLVAADPASLDWIKPTAGKPGEFHTEGVGKDRDVELVPFYRLHRRTYAAYWDLFSPAEWEKKSAELAAEREKQRKLEAATVAFLQPGEMQPERDFNQQGEATSVIGANVVGRSGRRGTKWFSFDVPVDPARPMALVVTYHSDQRRARTFDVLVDGERVGQQTIPQRSEARFFDVEYPVPKELVEAKAKVTVRFQSANDGEIGPVYGVRMIRADAER